MSQQSQVWWSFPGGIGWPTPIPLKGGKRKTRKARKARKGTRRMRGGNLLNNIQRKLTNMSRPAIRTISEKKALNNYTKKQNELTALKKQIENLKKEKINVGSRLRSGSVAAVSAQKNLNEKIAKVQQQINDL
jgi:hypothetical protein